MHSLRNIVSVCVKNLFYRNVNLYISVRNSTMPRRYKPKNKIALQITQLHKCNVRRLQERDLRSRFSVPPVVSPYRNFHGDTVPSLPVWVKDMSCQTSLTTVFQVSTERTTDDTHVWHIMEFLLTERHHAISKCYVSNNI